MMIIILRMLLKININNLTNMFKIILVCIDIIYLKNNEFIIFFYH